MKHMRRTFLLVLTAALVLTMTQFVCAADPDGNVRFDGSSMSQDFDGSTVQKTVSGLQPGGSADYTVRFTNDSGEQTNWYMTNKVLETLEDTANTPARNGGYSYTLSYISPSGSEKVLVTNDRIGGDFDEAKYSKDLEGLKQATNATGEFFFLDKLAPGQSGLIRLHVGLDGETQGNAYMDTAGKLEIAFAVEIPEEGSVVRTTYIQREKGNGQPGTGDNSSLTVPVIAMAAAIVLMILAVRSHRREQEGGDAE